MNSSVMEGESKVLSDLVIDNAYIHASTSDNTHRAYRSDRAQLWFRGQGMLISDVSNI